MKSILFVVMSLIATQTFAGPGHNYYSERYVTTVKANNTQDFVNAAPCGKKISKDEKLEKITLRVKKSSIKLNAVYVTQDLGDGANSEPLKLAVTSGNYKKGDWIKIKIPGNSCFSSIKIDSESLSVKGEEGEIVVMTNYLWSDSWF